MAALTALVMLISGENGIAGGCRTSGAASAHGVCSGSSCGNSAPLPKGEDRDMCVTPLLMALVTLLEEQEGRRPFSPCLEQRMIMQVLGRSVELLPLRKKALVFGVRFVFSKPCQYLLCQGFCSAHQKLQLCCQQKNRLEEEIIRTM